MVKLWQTWSSWPHYRRRMFSLVRSEKTHSRQSQAHLHIQLLQLLNDGQMIEWFCFKLKLLKCSLMIVICSSMMVTIHSFPHHWRAFHHHWEAAQTDILFDLRFRPRTSERAYIHIMKGSGCSSSVGKTGSQQSVSLGNGCVYTGKKKKYIYIYIKMIHLSIVTNCDF